MLKFALIFPETPKNEAAVYGPFDTYQEAKAWHERVLPAHSAIVSKMLSPDVFDRVKK